jgi:hypothetical protein
VSFVSHDNNSPHPATKPRRVLAKRENFKNMKSKMKPPKGWKFVTDGSRKQHDQYRTHDGGWSEIVWDGVTKQNPADIYIRKVVSTTKKPTPTPAQAWRWLARQEYLMEPKHGGGHLVTIYQGTAHHEYTGRSPLAAVRAAMRAQKGGVK